MTKARRYAENTDGNKIEGYFMDAATLLKNLSFSTGKVALVVSALVVI